MAWLIAVLISGFFAFWNLGSESYHPEDESLHVSVVQQMVFNDHLLIPHSEKGPYFNKPPLKMWMTVPLIKIFGSSPFVYRFWDAFFGFLTILMTFYLGKHLFDSYRIGIFAALFLCSATIFLFDHCIRSATQDSAVVLITTLALYWGSQYLHQTKVDKVILLLLTVTTAFGLFVKSVGALQGILMLIFVAILFRQSLKKILPLFLVVLVAAIPIASYFSWISLFHSSALSHALNTEILNRVVRGLQRRYEYFFYLDLIFNRKMAIDGFAFLIAIVTVAFSFARYESKLKQNITLVAVFAILPVVAFSFVSTRLEWYIVPALPAQALLCAFALFTLWNHCITAKSLDSHSNYFVTKAALISSFGVMFFGLIIHLHSTSHRIIFPVAKSSISQIETALANENDIKGVIVPTQIFKEVPSRFERAHLKSLARGNIYQAKSEEDFFQKTTHDKSMLTVGQPEEVISLFKNGIVRSYRSLPPVIQYPKQHQRKHWLTIISTSEFIPNGFTPVVQEYTLNSENSFFPMNDDVYARELGVDIFVVMDPLASEESVILTLKRHRNSGGFDLPCESKSQTEFVCRVSPEIMKDARASFGQVKVKQRVDSVRQYKVQIKIHSD